VVTTEVLLRKLLSLTFTLQLGLVPCHAQTPTAMPKDSNQAVAVIFYWKAKPGKLEEYSRYIQDVAEPIDRDAQRNGAFVSVVTFVSEKPESAWTHMRLFTLLNHAQAEGLKAGLDAATARIVPDEARRKANADYAVTLRDAVGSEEVLILSPKHAP
jgi:hypothetical protein